MAIELDGFAVLRAIAAHESAFAAARPEIVKFAKSIVAQRLKDKETGLAQLREIFAALGAESFALIVDETPDAQLKSILARLDKNWAEIKTAEDEQLRGHLRDLAAGGVEPAQAAKRAAKKPAKPAAEVKPAEAAPRLAFRSAGAKRKR
jgi:hypothetical protein